MNIQETVQQDIKDALKNKEEVRLSTLRMFSAALHNRSIEKRGRGEESALTDEESIAVLRSEVKKRRDAKEEFRRGGREDLAAQETNEISVLESYLPPEPSPDEIREIIREVIKKGAYSSEKDFGQVMKQTMKKLQGKASGNQVSLLVKDMLRYL